MEEHIHKPGARIGAYEVIAHLSTSGVCALYSARTIELGKGREVGRRVALKVCRYDPRSMSQARQDQFNDRLTREFNLLASLKHPNIVRVYERQSHDGLDFYALELLQGPLLGKWMNEDGHSYGERLIVCLQLTEALAYVHKRGIVIRDLRPSSVIVVPPSGSGLGMKDPRTVLMDFSNAQASGQPPLSPPGRPVGTAELTSPEYARKLSKRRGGKLHRATASEDVFRFGVLLYQMLTGRLPTKAAPEQVQELLEEIGRVVPPHPSKVNAKAPPAIAELAMACLAKEGALRPADGTELSQRLRETMAQDDAFLRKQAPVVEASREVPLADVLETTLDEWGEPPRAQKRSRLGESSRFLEEQLRRAGNELKQMRRALRQMGRTLDSVRVLVFASGALCVGVLALSVVLGPLIWRPARIAGGPSPEEDVDAQASCNLPAPGVALGQAVKAGYKIPDTPPATWLRPTAEGKCILSGVELRGLTVMRSTCWEKVEKMNPKVACPEPYYDPPPDAPAELKDYCFRPITVKPRNQAVTPVHAQDAGQK